MEKKKAALIGNDTGIKIYGMKSVALKLLVCLY